jgi:hypothetical protein
MREHLLDDNLEYHNTDWNCAYIDGFIDTFLENEFFDRVAWDLYIDEQYFSCRVPATKRKRGGDIREISAGRSIFSLSYTEVGGGDAVTIIDGLPISYFDKKEKRIAYYSSGRCGGWFLRTPELDTSSIYVVRADGSIGSASLSDVESYGVRPCIILHNRTVFYKNTLDGREIFVLALNYEEEE